MCTPTNLFFNKILTFIPFVFDNPLPASGCSSPLKYSSYLLLTYTSFLNMAPLALFSFKFSTNIFAAHSLFLCAALRSFPLPALVSVLMNYSETTLTSSYEPPSSVLSDFPITRSITHFSTIPFPVPSFLPCKLLSQTSSNGLT